MSYPETLEAYATASAQVRRAARRANAAQRAYETMVAEAHRMYPGVGSEQLRREHYWDAQQLARQTTAAQYEAEQIEWKAYTTACQAFHRETVGSREEKSVAA